MVKRLYYFDKMIISLKKLDMACSSPPDFSSLVFFWNLSWFKCCVICDRVELIRLQALYNSLSKH